MDFSLTQTGLKKADQIPIHILISSDDPKGHSDTSHGVPTGIHKKSNEEISFEIDHPLPLGSNIDIKTAKEPPDRKERDEVYKVYRGRIRKCVEVEGSHGARYEVNVQIFETVIQTEIVSSRLSLN
jgi:hypothetical protein